MTYDEEIIKEATEIYEKNENGGALVGDLLRIIKSQKAEIEKKDTEIDILIRKKEALRDEISELTAEIERLTILCTEQNEEISRLQKVRANILNVMKEKISQIQSEAYREFAKLVNRRLNSNTPRGAYLYNIMKDVEKELTESKNDFEG